MTAEIVVMNKAGIALATDSAVTIGNRDKFYNTAKKLFTLSKYHPVGIMIYNNAEFMGIPWEILIKQFRVELQERQYDTIDIYWNEFLKFIIEGEIISSNEYEKNYFIRTVYGLLKELDQEVKSVLASLASNFSEEELKEILDQEIKRLDYLINGKADLEGLPEGFSEYIIEKYDEELMRFIEYVIGIDSLRKESLEILKKMCINIFSKSSVGYGHTGIVVAGYGRKEIFPSMVAYEVYGMMNKHLKYNIKSSKKIDVSNDFAIIPFAQTDTVQTFLRGISPNFLKVVYSSYYDVIERVLDNVNYNLSNKNKNALKKDLSDKWREVLGLINKFSESSYVEPINRAVRVAPLDELAAMAESLVNITSFKRQVSLDENAQTVGGPIDVAVISKCDGFIWIKRKHYFKSDLNHHFFYNYFNLRESENNDE